METSALPAPLQPDSPRARPYANPSLAGIALGATLLISYLVLGTGLGDPGPGGQRRASRGRPPSDGEQRVRGGVFKVLFTAIVVAMLGARLLASTGAANLATWYQLETFLLPQTVAGLVFGVGFVMGGWCPGTALVGLVSGRADALFFLVGAFAIAAFFGADRLVAWNARRTLMSPGTGSCGRP